MAELNLKSRSSDYFFWVLTVSHSPQLPTGLRMFSPVRMPATKQKRRTNDRYEGNQKIFKKVHVGRREKEDAQESLKDHIPGPLQIISIPESAFTYL